MPVNMLPMDQGTVVTVLCWVALGSVMVLATQVPSVQWSNPKTVDVGTSTAVANDADQQHSYVPKNKQGLDRPDSSMELARQLDELAQKQVDSMQKAEAHLTAKLRELELAYTTLTARAEAAEAERDRRLQERYLGEARSERRKALRAWCELNAPEHQNSRNELKISPNEH